MALTTGLTVLTFAVVIGVSHGFIVLRWGPCPNVPTQPTFDLDRYLGTWYSYTNFDVPFQYGADCVTANYSPNEDGSINVVNNGQRRFKFFGRYYTYQNDEAVGRALIVDRAYPAALKVSFGGPDMGDKANYLIAETDYDNYSIVYSCSPLFGFINLESAWILTRQRGVKPDNLDYLMSVLSNRGVNVNNFKEVNNEQC